tara:strand:+ start:307 stop:579 length:273 start_codon:yes stop_codon:yes gene_type:complete
MKRKVKSIKWEHLKFEKHPNAKENEFAVCASIRFDNGEWCSIIGGDKSYYGDGVVTFEIYSSSTCKTYRQIKTFLTRKQVLRHLNYLRNK